MKLVVMMLSTLQPMAETTIGMEPLIGSPFPMKLITVLGFMFNHTCQLHQLQRHATKHAPAASPPENSPLVIAEPAKCAVGKSVLIFPRMIKFPLIGTDHQKQLDMYP